MEIDEWNLLKRYSRKDRKNANEFSPLDSMKAALTTQPMRLRLCDSVHRSPPLGPGSRESARRTRPARVRPQDPTCASPPAGPHLRESVRRTPPARAFVYFRSTPSKTR